jgi:hypothetical protein
MFPVTGCTQSVSFSSEGMKEHRVKPNFRCYYLYRLLLFALCPVSRATRLIVGACLLVASPVR